MTVFSQEAQEKLRGAAATVLQRLNEESKVANPPSWVNGSVPLESDNDTRSPACRFFDHAGFLHLPGFVDATTTCRLMKEQMIALVEREWHPSTTQQQQLDSFGTDAEQNVARGAYFLESADKVHFFAEPGALMAEDPQQPQQQQELRPIYHNNKVCALNKAGHALHLPFPHHHHSSIFHEYTFASETLRATVLDLGWKDPVVPQSMYIFKQAATGGAVHSHQDSTFLYTTPRQTCLGLWLAVDDATLENGCLWVRPCSHTTTEGSTTTTATTTRRQYKRNVKHFGEASIAARSNDAIDPSQPTFEMVELFADPKVPWDGGLPGDDGDTTAITSTTGDWTALLDAGFIPIECKAGDLLAFCGELDHLSLPNTSDKARHTFQLHLVEGPSQGVEWSPYNWLQYPSDKSFLRLLGD